LAEGERLLLEGETVITTLRPLTFEERSHVEKYLRRLKRKGDIRQLAERLLNGESVPEALSPLVGTLERADSPWRERVVAAWLLPKINMTMDQRAVAGRAMAAAIKRHETISPFLGCLGCAAGPAVLLTLPLAFVAAVVDDNRLHQVRAAAARAMAEMRDPKAAGPLARAIRDYAGGRSTTSSQRAEKAAAEALPRVLEKLAPEHYGQVGPSEIDDLCWVMRHAKEPLAIAILQALEKVGDGGAVRPVEQLARSARSEAMRSEAIRILPILQERYRKATEAQSLLRAAEPGSDQNTLLRPVADTGPAYPERLLRSVMETEAHEEDI
jgi:HEAT repeat protein